MLLPSLCSKQSSEAESDNLRIVTSSTYSETESARLLHLEGFSPTLVPGLHVNVPWTSHLCHLIPTLTPRHQLPFCCRASCRVSSPACGRWRQLSPRPSSTPSLVSLGRRKTWNRMCFSTEWVDVSQTGGPLSILLKSVVFAPGAAWIGERFALVVSPRHRC